jgi:hypothetical protein
VGGGGKKVGRGAMTGIAVSIHPDLLHCPPLFQLKTFGLFTKSSEVSTKSSELLHLPLRRKIKSSEVFEISYLHVFTRLLNSLKKRLNFLRSASCTALKTRWVICCNRASLPGKLIALRFINAHSSSCKLEQLNFSFIVILFNKGVNSV